MITHFNNHPLSNSLNVFNYYKQISGRSLEKDVREIDKRQKILNDPKSTDEQIDKAYEIDPLEIIQTIYYAMRCAAEKKLLDISEVNEEVTTEDLANGALEKAVLHLFNEKKNRQGLFAKLRK